MNRDIIWIERKKTIDIMDQMSSVGLFVYLPLLILCRRNNAMNWWENSCNNKKCEYVCIYPYMASVSPTAILIRIDLWFFDSFQFISRVEARSTNKLFILWPKNNSNEEIQQIFCWSQKGRCQQNPFQIESNYQNYRCLIQLN